MSMTTASSDLTLIAITDLQQTEVNTWMQHAPLLLDARVVAVLSEAEARITLEQESARMPEHALLGVARFPSTTLSDEGARILEAIAGQIAQGHRCLAWHGCDEPSGSHDVEGALLASVMLDRLPSAVAPVDAWRKALAPGDAGTSPLIERLFRSFETFVAIGPRSDRAVGQTRRSTSEDVLRDVQDARGLVSLMRVALDLQSLGVPGWAEHGASVVDMLLRCAVRTVAMDRSELATELHSIASRFEPGDDESYSARNRDIIAAIRAGEAAQLIEALRTRVLVVGHDLKFIDFVYSYLPEAVSVREDRWTGEKRHDAARSRELAAWADVVWVEWLAYSALWYSKAVRDDQVLIVRQHRYELLREVGEEIDYNRVSAVIAIAVHTMEGVHERFGVPRDKLRLVPNIYEGDRYTPADARDEARQFRIALVGSVPRLKGLHRAIEVIQRLRAVDDRYSLTIFGRRPEDLPWVLSNPDEGAYFAACEAYIAASGLSDAVAYAGWADIRKELHRYGYVLSTSDLEGSHVSPGEAFLTGNAGLYLDWRGAEYIYPPEFGFESPQEMADYIAAAPLARPDVQARIKETAEHLAREQGVAAFFSSVQAIIREQPL